MKANVGFGVVCTTVILVFRKIGLGDLVIEANLSYKVSPPKKNQNKKKILTTTFSR